MINNKLWESFLDDAELDPRFLSWAGEAIWTSSQQRKKRRKELSKICRKQFAIEKKNMELKFKVHDDQSVTIEKDEK